MKTKIIAIILATIIVVLTLCACGSADAKAAYKPPTRVFDVEIEGTSEPRIDGVEITYDSKARIDTVTYSVDDYDYKQEYSYDSPEQIVIKTIYKTEVICEQLIDYSDVPVNSGFTSIDGYIIRVTEDMPVIDNTEDKSDSEKVSKTNDKGSSEQNPKIDYNNLVGTAKIIGQSRLPEILIDSTDARMINSEIIESCDPSVHDGACDYVFYTNKGILSVIVGANPPGGDYFFAWTVEIESGKRLNNNDLIKTFSVDNNRIVEKIKEAEDNHFGDKFDYNWNESIISIFDDAYENTMDSKNLNKYELAVGKNGLLAIVREYTMAGAGLNTVIIDLNVPRTYTKIDELNSEY
jgi:hypothetical protein